MSLVTCLLVPLENVYTPLPSLWTPPLSTASRLYSCRWSQRLWAAAFYGTPSSAFSLESWILLPYIQYSLFTEWRSQSSVPYIQLHCSALPCFTFLFPFYSLVIANKINKYYFSKVPQFSCAYSPSTFPVFLFFSGTFVFFLFPSHLLFTSWRARALSFPTPVLKYALKGLCCHSVFINSLPIQGTCLPCDLLISLPCNLFFWIGMTCQFHLTTFIVENNFFAAGSLSEIVQW